MKNSEQPAFAHAWQHTNRDGTTDQMVETGLTKREYISTAVLTGLMTKDNSLVSTMDRAKQAVEIADALLSELEKPAK